MSGAPAAHATPALQLPLPERERFQPLRAGICNIWHYDDQEFWFHDGRLILRGENEVGKSKALELLIPFLFDADLRPQRLDPFGEKSKNMFWNLVGFDTERSSAIGYVWLEFGRMTGQRAEFVTLGAGMRASRGANDVKPWYFVTSLRVRQELSLLEGRTPLSQPKLEAALGDAGRVYDVAKDYRDRVDDALFGLGKDRYQALVHLLLQLRRPHLSDRLDPAALSDLLTTSLPPLDDTRIHTLAGAFDSLDADAKALDHMERDRDAVMEFRKDYRVYARYEARKRAGGVRAATTRFDNVARKVREAADLKQKAENDIAALEDELASRQERRSAVEGGRRGLEDSDEARAGHRLDELKQLANSAREAATQQGRQLETTRADLGSADEEALSDQKAMADAEEVRAKGEFSAVRLAARADLTVIHETHAATLRTHPATTQEALDTTIRSLLQGIAELRKRRGQMKTEEEKAADLRRRVGEARERKEIAEQAVAMASRVCQTHESALEVAIRGWLEELQIPFTETQIQAVLNDALGRIAAGGSAARAGDVVIEPLRRQNDDEIVGVRATQRALVTRRRALLEAKEKILAERDEGPATRAGRSTDRNGRPGAALWQLCDFDEGVDGPCRASLEAALEAAGILDAWVTPDGRLLDRDLHDVVLIRGSSPAIAIGRTLADVLQPVAQEHVATEIVHELLRGVALAEDLIDDDHGAAVNLQGEWRVGPLRGRWQKTTAEHIGAPTRAARRLRRVAEIDSETASIDSELAKLGCSLEDLQTRAEDLRERAAYFPDGADLRIARAELVRLGKEAGRAREELQALEKALVKASERVEQARHALHDLAERLGLRGALDDLEGRTELLHAYRTALATLVAACQRCLDLAVRAASTSKRRHDLRGRMQKLAESAGSADWLATEREAEAAAFEQRVGASIAEVARRLEELRREHDALRTRIDEIGKLLRAAQGTFSESVAKLEAAEEDRRQRAVDRDDAIARLAQLANAEHLALAVPELVTVGEPTQLSVSTALDLSRRIEAQTSDVALEGDSGNRISTRAFEAFNSLRAALGGDFSPSMSNDEGLLIITVQHNGKMRTVGELADILNEETARRRELLENEERTLIERHLIGDVGLHLQERLVSARRLVDGMNHQLAEHPTNSGITLRLRWLPVEGAEQTGQALRLLQKDVRLLGEQDHEALVRFLRQRITEARETEGGGSSAERMGRALDYRQWHRFEIVMERDGVERVMTRKAHGEGSGGSKAVLIHLPLFAAASAHYRSARPEAPHLIALDEAFAGVDAGQRGSCMGLLVEFDLDFALTNFEEWGCYEEVPGIATYQLERIAGTPGVGAVRFVWDGQVRVENDPFLQWQLAGGSA